MQTSQNFPKYIKTYSNTHPDPRIPYIIQRVLEGATYETIAGELNLDRRALYDIRCKTETQDYVNQLYDIHMRDIAKFSQAPTAIERTEALRERGRMLRSIIPQRVDVRSQRLEVQAKINLDNRRLESGDLLEKVRGRGDGLYEALKEILLEQE